MLINFRVRDGVDIEAMTKTLCLISLKIAQLHSKMEVNRGEDFLTKDEKYYFTLLYHLANRHFTSDDEPDLGRLYGDETSKILDE